MADAAALQAAAQVHYTEQARKAALITSFKDSFTIARTATVGVFKHEVGDFHRFKRDIVAVLESAGNGLALTLRIAQGDATRSLAPIAADRTFVQVLAAANADMDLPGEKQSAILALVRNNLDKESSFYDKYVLGNTPCTVATGTEHGRIGLWNRVENEFGTPVVAVKGKAKIDALMEMEFPEERSVAHWQTYFQKVVTLAIDADLDDSDLHRELWISKITKPREGSVWCEPVLSALSSVNCMVVTVADRNAFSNRIMTILDVMPDVVSKRSVKARKVSIGDFTERCACNDLSPNACAVCVDEVCEIEASAAAFARGGRSTTGNERGTRTKSSRPFPPRKCQRCGEVHGPKFNCTVKCKCSVCNSTEHIGDFCFISNGVPPYVRLPSYVLLQYVEWHKQYLAGTYQKEANGPSRVRPPSQRQIAARCGEIDPGDGVTEADRRQFGSMFDADEAQVYDSTIDGGSAEMDVGGSVALTEIVADSGVPLLLDQYSPSQARDAAAHAELVMNSRASSGRNVARSDRRATEMAATVAELRAEMETLRHNAMVERTRLAVFAERDAQREQEIAGQRAAQPSPHHVAPNPADARKYWACRTGRAPGVYAKYHDELVDGFPHNEHKWFADIETARDWMADRPPPPQEPAPLSMPVRAGPEPGHQSWWQPYWWVLTFFGIFAALLIVAVPRLRVDTLAFTWTNHMLVDSLAGSTVLLSWDWVVKCLAAFAVIMIFRRACIAIMAFGIARVAAVGLLPGVALYRPSLWIEDVPISFDGTEAIQWIEDVNSSNVSHSPWLLSDGSLAGVNSSNAWENAPIPSPSRLIDGTIGEIVIPRTWDELFADEHQHVEVSASLVSLNPAVRREGPAPVLMPGFFRVTVDSGSEAFCYTTEMEKHGHIIQENPNVVVRTADGKRSKVRSLIATRATYVCEDTSFASGIIEQGLVLESFPKPLYSVGYAGDQMDICTLFGSKSLPSNSFIFPNGQVSCFWGPPYGADIAFSNPHEPNPYPDACHPNACVAEPDGVVSVCAGTVSETTCRKWHWRFMHADSKVVENAPLVCIGMDIKGKITPNAKHHCEVCALCKPKLRSIGNRTDIEVTFCGQATQMDTWGPAIECLYYTGCRYAVGFRDVKSRFTWVVMCKDRSR